MKAFGVMQPYFLPYIGYFQLLNLVDEFIIYDNIEFTKKGWINRNRIMVGGEPQYFTINLVKGSDFLMVNERFISPVFKKERTKILNKIRMSYRKAAYFEESMPLIERCFMCEHENLFEYIFYSIKEVVEYLNINTELVVSSSLEIDHALKNKYKLWEMARCLGFHRYVNPIGGHSLYEKDEFDSHGLMLQFHQSQLREYQQVGRATEFVPALSIMDLLLCEGKEGAKEQLSNYTIS